MLLIPFTSSRSEGAVTGIRANSASGLESCPSLGYNMESTTGYTFTPCVGYFTYPGI